MKSSILLLVVLVSVTGNISESHAALPTGLTVTVQPIVGYNFQKKSDPERTEKVFVYGARVIAGYRILSGEAEHTRGKSDETFESPARSIEEESEKTRLGIRSTYDLGTILSFTARGGAELSKSHITETTAGVTTESDSPSRVDPYVGAGLGIHLFSKVSLTAEAVATIRDTNDLSKTEYTTTLGVNISFL